MSRGLRGVGREISYGEAKRLILELLRETGSHLSADMRKLDRAASQAEVALIMLTTGFLEVNRDRKVRPEPFVVPGPWDEDDPNADVTPELRAELEARLAASSPFG